MKHGQMNQAHILPSYHGNSAHPKTSLSSLIYSARFYLIEVLNHHLIIHIEIIRKLGSMSM